MPVPRLIACETTTGRDSTYYAAVATNKELGATRGIDAALKAHNLDALVLPAPGYTTIPAGAMKS
jgi:amidase